MEKELCPSNDPLTLILTWDYKTRQKVVRALKPYITINAPKHATTWNGSITWLVNPVPIGDQLSENIELLTRAVGYELFGVDIECRLTTEQANEMADAILSAGKNAL